MNRVITAMLALIFSALFLTPAAAIAADNAVAKELVELYNNTTFPLWGSREDKEPLCAISYLLAQQLDIFNKEVERSFLVSAGHCGGGALRLSDSFEYIVAVLGTVVTGTHDELIASALDLRGRVTYFGPPRSPRSGETVYAAKTLMRHNGKTELQRLEFVGRNEAAKSLLFRGEVPIQKGMSGSPVISADGEFLGIIVRLNPADDYLYEIIPAETVMRTLSFTRE